MNMRIRNSYPPPPSPSSPPHPPLTISSRSQKRLHNSDDQMTFDRSRESSHSHVMISRINSRINNVDSTSRSFNNQEQNQGIVHEEEEDEEKAMDFARSNQSLIGGWREEEKTIPLKKRRMISSEEERRDNSMDRGKMVKEDDDLMRCGRTDGRKWRCSRKRVEGYSMCEHHLRTRSARYRNENSKTEIDEEEEEGDKKKEKGYFGKYENEDGNDNKRKGVKARSISSLLRDTAPLMPLNM